MHSTSLPVRFVTQPAIRRPIWQGEQRVSALWFTHDIYPEAERQALILRLWQSGATAYGFAAGDLLCWRVPQLLRCNQTHGLPLCKIGPILTSAPFTPTEIKLLGIADAYIVQGAVAEVLLFEDATLLDPSAWLDLSRYPLLPIVPLAPQPDVVHALVAPASNPTLHDVLGSVPQPAPERNQLLQALMQQPPQGSSHDSQTLQLGKRVALALTAGIAMVALLLQPLWALMSLLLRQGAAGSGSDGSSASPSTPPPAQQKVSSPSALRQWLNKLLQASQLSKLFDRQHAAYMRKMLKMFEQDNLDEALRHAIPLSAAHDISLGQQLGTLRPRDQLNYGLARQYAQGVDINPTLREHLTQLYQRAFNRFDEANQIDRAVYVLAELLNRKQAALEYLEKHGRYRQAAELCQTWELPAAFAIRMYLMIGDVEKARWLAIQSNEFAAAVHVLESRHPEHALTLRKIWAHALTQQGRWLEAVEVIWKVESERDKALTWLHMAEKSHGELGLRAWLQRLLLLPEQIELEMERARQLCSQAQRQTLRRAIVMVVELYHKTALLLPTPLLTLWAPFMLTDWQQGKNNLTLKDVRRWIEWTRNPMLRSDLPKLDAKSIVKRPQGLVNADLHLTAPEMGVWEIYDAFPLSNGCTLVALGDAGVVVINADQVELYRINIPAHQLTLSDSLEIALLLAQREEGWWVTRLDLVTRQTTVLGLTDLTQVAPTFDGIAWTAVGDNSLQVIDTRYSARQLLFTPTPLSSPVLGMTRNSSAEFVLLAGHNSVTLNQYQMPMRRLAASTSLPHTQPPADQVTIGSDGGLVSFWFMQEATAPELFRMATWSRAAVSFPRPVDFGDYQEALAHVIGDWTLILFSTAARTIWMFYSNTTRQLHARIDWPDALQPNFRYVQGEWLLFDRHGRMIKINDQSGHYVQMTLS